MRSPTYSERWRHRIRRISVLPAPCLVRMATLAAAAFWAFCAQAFAQIEVVLDNDGPGFTATGQWLVKTTGDPYGGTALYKRKGDGSATARWQTALTFPGTYQLDVHVVDGNYAEDTRLTIHGASGDTVVVDNQNYRPGWHTLGTFDLPETTWVQVSDYFEGNGRYVLADAVRLTSLMHTYAIGGEVLFPPGGARATSLVVLYRQGSTQPLMSVTQEGTRHTFRFEQVVEGWYWLVCVAWGYDTLRVDSLHVYGGDLLGLALPMRASPGPRHSMTGTVLFDDDSDTAVCRVVAYPAAFSLPAAYDSVRHGQPFHLANLPAGRYRLQFFARGYTPDSTTYADVHLEGGDRLLEPLTLARVFRFAWLSDSHIGAGSTEAGLVAIIGALNQMASTLDFVLHTGDLTERGLDGELQQYLDLMRTCKLPVWSIPGNHDTKWSESGLHTLKRHFGALRFSFSHYGFRFIGVNAGIPLRGGGGYFDPVDIAWLREELATLPSPDTPVVFACHFPLDFGSMYNCWQVLDLLKQYRTVFILVGHGHSNRAYDFEGIPGAMTRDTYAGPVGFNVVSVSKREIVVTPYTVDGQPGQPWLRVPCAQAAQPSVEFLDLEEGQTISGTRTVRVQISAPAAWGSWQVTYGPLSGSSVSGSLSGAGQEWHLSLPTEGLEDGYHTLQVTFTTSAGQRVSRTRGFILHNQGPRAVWRYNAGAEVITAPACDGERVYIGTSDGRIMALRLDDGTPAWPAVQTAGAVFSAPAVSDGVLYCGATDGTFYAVNAATGEVLWTYRAEGAVLTPPVVVDTTVYFAGNQIMYALSTRSHHRLWQYRASGMIECKPAVAGDLVLFGSWDRQVRALDRHQGSLRWSWNRTSSFYYAPAACWPVATAERVFVSDPQRYVSAISLADGSTIWSSKTPEAWESIGLSEDRSSTLYVRALDGCLYAVLAGAPNQLQLWKSNVAYGWDTTPSMPMEKQGTVFTGSKQGFVVAVATWGGMLWRYWLTHAYVATVTPLDGERVLAAALDGTVALIHGTGSGVPEPRNSLQAPERDQLLNPFPNPFNRSVVVAYRLSRPQTVRCSVVNVRGAVVFSHVEHHRTPGEYHITWQGTDDSGQDLPSGVYFVVVQGQQFREGRKVALVK